MTRFANKSFSVAPGDGVPSERWVQTFGRSIPKSAPIPAKQRRNDRKPKGQGRVRGSGAWIKT